MMSEKMTDQIIHKIYVHTKQNYYPKTLNILRMKDEPQKISLKQ